MYLKKEISKAVSERINRFYEDFSIYGGYPAVVLSETNEEKIEVLKNIYNTYFLREIKEILQLQDDFKLSKLIKVLALRIGSTINHQELSLATGMDYKELLKKMNILEKTYICIESKPFFTNKKKEITKSPKIYFLDNGFRNIVIKNFQKLNNRVDKGQLNENFAASELIKKEVELKFWRTKSKAEVDFVIENKGEVMPVEIKTKQQKLSRSFQAFIKAYKPKKAFILQQITADKTKKFEKTKVEFANLFEISKIAEILMSSQ